LAGGIVLTMMKLKVDAERESFHGLIFM
jgi:hypothetical protein